MKHEQHPNLVGLIFAFIFIVVFVRVAISADIQSEINFETQILPILKNRCFSCHSAPTADSSGTIRKPKGGIQLDSVEGIETSQHGEVIVAGEPEDSLLYRRIILPEGDTGIMPPQEEGAPLIKQETDLIRKWIEQGATYGEWQGNQSEPKLSMPNTHLHQPTVMPPITSLAFSHGWKICRCMFPSGITRLRFSYTQSDRGQLRYQPIIYTISRFRQMAIGWQLAVGIQQSRAL